MLPIWGTDSVTLRTLPRFSPILSNLLGTSWGSSACSYFLLLWNFQLPTSRHPWSSYSVSLGKHHEAIWCQHSSSGKWESLLLVTAPVVYKLSFSWFKICLVCGPPKKWARQCPDNGGIFLPQCESVNLSTQFRLTAWGNKGSSYQQASKNKTLYKLLVLTNTSLQLWKSQHTM